MRRHSMTGLWLRTSATRRRIFHRQPHRYSPRIREDAIRKYAPGRSFIDVGGMWNAHGRDAFFAEEMGATSVTLLDLSETDKFSAQLHEQNSRVRFVQGDLHDETTRAGAGQHDVVWCSGVLYHTPDPVHTLKCLRELATEFLIIHTSTIPEVPGVAQACVFWPGLDEPSRRHYSAAFDRQAGRGQRVGLSSEFAPEAGYDNWWWGMSASAVTAMLTAVAGEVVESVGHDLYRRFVVRVRQNSTAAG